MMINDYVINYVRPAFNGVLPLYWFHVLRLFIRNNTNLSLMIL